MADAKQNMFTNVALAPYQSWLDRCRDFDEVIIVSDCCRSIMTKVPEAPQPHTSCDEPARREQRVFLAHAADLGHLAFEARTPGDESRGHLTRALLEGLNGAAAEPWTGDVCATGLAEHIRARVRELSKGGQRAQLTFDDRIVFCGRSTTTHVVQIDLRESAERRSVRVLNGDRVVATDVRRGGTWEVCLPDGNYELLDTASATVVRFAIAGAPQRVTA